MNAVYMRRLIALSVIALSVTGCIIWRPSGGGLLNPCGSHRCDARPASYKKPDAPPCREGETVLVYDLRDGFRRVQIAPPLCTETRAQKRKRIEAERRKTAAQRKAGGQ